MPVPLFDPNTPLEPLRERLDDALLGVLDDGRFILGPNVAAFEQEFAAFIGAGHAIGVANGTEALTIALRALGVGPGDEVIVPSFTFYASAEAIPPTGATPVFCDVDPRLVPRHARDGARGDDAADQGGDRRPPVRQRRAGRARSRRSACRSSRTPRRPPARSDRTGAPARSGRSPRSPSTRRRTSARSATAARSRRATTRSPSACARCASTARATRSRTRRSATTAASTSCRPRSCA